MLPKEFTYPRFEANQVLQSKHLNDLFRYLDEQNRLTRTNLIGIGIVCGLDVVPVGSTQLRLLRGCGNSSAGYLITFGETDGVLSDKTYARYRPFAIPADATPYPPFYNDPAAQTYFPLWELVEGNPAGSQALTANFLRGNGNANDEKVVILYVELDEEKLKNCAPNSCDDKGNQVQVAFRPLLLRRQDADTMLSRAATLPGGAELNVPRLEAALPAMRLPRFDVPATTLGSTTQVIEAYRAILTKDFIENTLKKNWSDAYTLLGSTLSGISNDFLGWNPPYGPDDKVQLPESYQYQYFYDLLSDLIQAYDELRRQAGELLAFCCPPEGLFPRHLFLGLASENTAQVTSQYRHYFRPSPVIHAAKSQVAMVRALVQKAMRMLGQFRVPARTSLEKGSEIRITPSHLGRGPLSEKAIPYYYDLLAGTPPLLSLWNPARSQYGQANHNLSYYAPNYPASTPDFVAQPLRYDLEPYNFLRIEGHVGMPVREALTTLTELRNRQRLPFDVVAVRTGNALQGLSTLRVEDLCCCFDDLETMFRIALLELRCLYAGSVRKLIGADAAALRYRVTDADVARAKASTEYLKSTLSAQDLEIGELWARFGNNAPHDVPLDEANLSTLDFDLQQIGLLALRQAYQLPPDLPGMENYLAAFEDGTQRLLRAVETVLAKVGKTEDAPRYADRQRLLETMARQCRLAIFKLLLKEYRTRLEKVLQALLLSHYAQAQPGLQHKAGVPMGGTFVLVCHGETQEKVPQERFTTQLTHFVQEYTHAQRKIADTREELLENYPWAEQLRALLGYLERERTTVGAVEANLPVGMVFADFYLPYLCCSGCVPTVVFPPERPTEVPPLAVALGEPDCVRENTAFEITLTLSGGTPPYVVDGSAVSGASHRLIYASGTGATVVVEDSGQGTSKQTRTVTIPAHRCQPVEECDLPCGGEAKRCRYLLWMERPGRGDVLSHFGTHKAALTLPDYGVDFDFTGEFNGIIGTSNALSTDEFDSIMKGLIKQLNEIIRQKIGPGRFVLGYDKTYGLLTIQHFICEHFELFIESDYELKSRGISQRLRVQYLPEATIWTDERAQETGKVPAFGCETANLCKQEDFKPTCEAGPKITNIRILENLGHSQYLFTFTPKTSFDFCFWTFGGQPQPRYSHEKEPTVAIPPRTTQVPIRLLAITKDGCFDIREQVVELPRG
ncbi:hypothetical protein GCM10027275_02930 [Rhabdobacter roseus]|uniref:Uncharacterized protein n=1 Tax=Rhabdobacter roseus TaxID=1655419 RepID=A0A840TG51_9BACT|nr:hypothetical protein [Rhabdobacter roseus]MBB5282181.1 hypothetical protein [Rhabdobacter roseus]